MPIYEYECEKCGEFEQMQRITDPPLARCPTCKRKVRRLISSTSFQLKGTGWYVTDYAKSGSGNGGKKRRRGRLELGAAVVLGDEVRRQVREPSPRASPRRSRVERRRRGKTGS